MQLHLLSTARVAKELQTGSLDPDLSLRYLAAWLIIMTFVAYYNLMWPSSPDALLVVQAALILIIIGVGVYASYKANGGARGVNFTERFVALAVPLTVCVSVGYEVIYQCLYFIYPYLAASLSEDEYRKVWARMDFLGSVLVEAFWYFRVRKWFLTINSGSHARSST